MRRNKLQELCLETAVGLIIALLLFCFFVTINIAISHAEPIVIWDPVTKNVDGTDITDLKNYKLLVSSTPGVYMGAKEVLVAPDVTTHEFTDLTPGEYTTVVLAIDEQSNQSQFSNELEFIVPPLPTIPKAPTRYRLKLVADISFEPITETEVPTDGE